jgi:hypothetical protein
MINIGDVFDTEAIGRCKIIDIFISTTTQDRVYKCICEDGMEIFLTGQELNT